MKAISVNIFKHKGNSYSNHGISSKYDEILLIHPEGWIDIDENNPPENLCVVKQKVFWGNSYYYVEPYANPSGIGWMYGGTICESSDSRFRSIGHGCPLRLHDRQETAEEYEMLSR